MVSGEVEVLARAVLASVGGAENVASATHCMTRLRLVLCDEGAADEAAVKEIPGVLGAVRQGGQFQVIIGPDVARVFDALESLWATSGQSASVGSAESAAGSAPAAAGVSTKDTPSLHDVDDAGGRPGAADTKLLPLCTARGALELLTASVVPCVDFLGAAAILRGALWLLASCGVGAEQGSVLALLIGLADVSIYLLPVLVAFSAARKLNVSVWPPVGIAAVQAYAFAVAPGSVPGPLGGMPFLERGAGLVFSAVVTAWLCALVERAVAPRVPTVTRSVLAPLAVLTVVGAGMGFVVGPLVMSACGAVSFAVHTVFLCWPVTTALVIGAVWQLVVARGLHWLFTPLLLGELVALGSDPIMLVTVIPQLSQAGIALGAALVASDAARRHQALATTGQALFGKTEPALYGFTLAVPHLQAAANVASGLAAAAAIALGGTFYGVTGGVLGILGTVGPEGAGCPDGGVSCGCGSGPDLCRRLCGRCVSDAARRLKVGRTLRSGKLLGNELRQ